MSGTRSRSLSPQNSEAGLRPDKKARLDTTTSSTKIEPSPQSGKQPASGDSPAILSKKSDSKAARKTKAKRKRILPEPHTAEFVVAADVASLLGKEVVDKAVADGLDWDSPFGHREELEVTVSCLSSTGDSLSVASSTDRQWVIVTPLALPAEKIRVRVYRNGRLYSHADLLEVITPNLDLRDMTRVECRYFGKCAGCQYQMLTYEKQLELKRSVVVKAYDNFSRLPLSSIPPILDTIASPLQYGYRTKITPHFDAPPKRLQKTQPQFSQTIDEKPDWLKIGFNQIGTRHVMDIEECPIATGTINEALGPLRRNIIQNIYSYKKGVSLLLRDSLKIPPAENHAETSDKGPSSSNHSSTPSLQQPIPAMLASDGVEVASSGSETHTCVTDHNAIVRERVGDDIFNYTAGTFFQNNNSALLPLTSYVRDAIFLDHHLVTAESHPPTHLVDAYCGSGLFAITLARSFIKVFGIELSEDSIRSARHNAEINHLPTDRCTFMAGDAANIFATVQDFPRDKTVLIIDPPRKGTDERFIDQLLQFNCATVVYVSCNVHTQARDVGMILRRSEERDGGRYVLQSLRGLDLFPQTAHVEAIAVLRLVQ